MKKQTKSVAMVALLATMLALCTTGCDKWHDLDGLESTVVAVIDGNTIELENGLEVELLGIEGTPSSKKCLFRNSE